MSTTNSQVAHVWAQGNNGVARGSHFYCSNNELFSYYTCVGVIHQGVIFLPDTSMTPSTGRQLSHAKQACSYHYFETSAFFYGSGQAPTAEQCIISAAETHIEEFKTLLRARKPQVEGYTERRQFIIEMADRFNVVIPGIPEATGDLKEKARAYKEAEKVKEAARIEKAARDLATRQEADKVQFDTWITTGEGSCPYSYRRHYTYQNDKTTDFITLRGDTIVTSQGAEAPLDHVIKALRFYELRRDFEGPMDGPMYKPYQTNGHKIPLGHFTLDSIDESGNVKAGCHYFTSAEIARFRAQWNL